MHPHKDWSVETCNTLFAGPAVDLHKHSERSLNDVLAQISETAGASNPQGVPLRASQVLGFAAEKYGISGKMSDHVAVPIIIMPSDLPNRNKVGFPLKRLSEFDTHTGMLAYETWRHMPTHMEHVNQDYSIAKGMVLDVGIRPMENARSGLWKVNALLSFDRSRDPELANAILTKQRTAYSMGAYVSSYSCSICGAETARKDRPCCDHVSAKSTYDTFIVDGKRRLAHWNTGAFKGFEISSVSVPAYTSAINPELVWS